MSSVKDAVERYFVRLDQPNLAKRKSAEGGELQLPESSAMSVPAASADTDVVELRSDLRRIRGSSTLLFGASVAGSVALAAFTLFAPTDVSRLLGLVGEGLGLTGVFRAWRAKIDVDLLLALLAVAKDGTERRKLVEVFRRPLRDSQRAAPAPR